LNFKFKRSPAFRAAFDDLNDAQKNAANEAYKVFKKNPFDPSLRVHKINRLTSLYGSTVLSVTIQGNLRAVFTIEGSDVISLDIGTHDIYK
jgi:hypothetical protein